MDATYSSIEFNIATIPFVAVVDGVRVPRHGSAHALTTEISWGSTSAIS